MTIAEKIQQIINERNSLITILNAKGFNIPDDTKLGDLIDIVENTDIGGDTPSAGKKAVNFYDYDGTLLHSYTREEVLGLSELPALLDRSDEGLTCQGWNWTLENIKAELTNREDLDYLAVGANYITTDGATHINITFTDKYRNSMPLMFTGDVTIDWGDGVIESVNHESATIITHEYAIVQSYPVKYTIKLTVNSGTLTFGDGSNRYNICGRTKNYASNSARIYASRIDSVFIGNGVTSIGSNVFYQCYSLASVTIPSSVTNIGDYAFSDCYSLTSISIPNSVTSIGIYAFYYCYTLTSISIPISVTSIGSTTFRYCYSLTSISIPSSVTSISDYAFSNCYSLASISIPNSVTHIDNSTFYGCYSLTSISIPSSVTSISERAFYGCYSLASVTIPSSVTNIGSSAFFNCYSLTSISIPNSVTSIGSSAFSGCSSIIKYDFSAHISVPTLSDTNVFTDTATDKQIVVPDNLYDIWIAATNWATYASYIVKASEYVEPRYVPPHTIITYTNGNTTEVEVGDDGILTWQMTKGAGNQYAENTTIQSVEIGSDVTLIGREAFSYCTGLTSITIPSTVTLISIAAFAYCSGLTSITIPASVTEIGTNAFYGCSGLTSVTIPSSVTRIVGSVFTSCSSLDDITFDKTMNEVSSISFYPWGIPSGKVIKCTDGNITVS